MTISELLQTLFQSEDTYKAIDMKMIFLLLMQIKLIFKRKILHLASLSKWE